MTVQAFRIQNFMCFEDSDWVELRPLTLFYGRNSAGKSAFLRALLLLRQSLASQPDQEPLIFAPNDGFDFGGYRTVVRDHDVGQALSFWFECQLSPDVEGDASEMISRQVVKALSGLGVSGTTVQVRLSYRFHDEQVRLDSVALYDDVLSRYDEDKLIWKATAPHPDAGAEERWRFEADFFRKLPANVWPESALVVSEGFFPELRPIAPSKMPQFCHIQQLLCHCKGSILDFIKSMAYIGPRRPDPQRFYHLTKQTNGHSANGQHLVSALLSEDTQSKKTLSSINQWLDEFGLPKRLQVKLADSPTSYQLRFIDPYRRTIPPFQANITEVGFGMSQLLPVVIETLLAPENSTLVLEQPELHLHPGVQAQLGDLFIEVAIRHKVRLLIETHSETLLIRMRRRLAESSLDILSAEDIGYLPYNAFRAYFVDHDQDEGQSEVMRLGITEEGGLVGRPQGFIGFFADDLRETAALTKAQLGF